jgi:Fe-S oxidoreductase
LDIRGLIEKINQKDWAGAYRLYAGFVLFPSLVSKLCPRPCEIACQGAAQGNPIALGALERACVALSPEWAQPRFNLPKRKGSVAIVGAGLGGLACALRLASKKYQVTVFEETNVLGGKARVLLPAETIDGELRTKLEGESIGFEMGKAVRDLSEMSANAIFVATGLGGTAFGRLEPEAVTPYFTEPNVFVGGGLLGADVVWSIAHGLLAAQAIEAYLKSGLAVWKKHVPKSRALGLPFPAGPRREEPADGFGPELAAMEAKRCPRCDCDKCRESCDLMRYFNKYPSRIGDEVYATLNPVKHYGQRLATRLAASCQLCGLCGEACPEGIDTGELLGRAREELRQSGSLPPAFHDYWLRDFAQATGEEAALIMAPPDGPIGRVFFPGCQLGAANPLAVWLTYRHLLNDRPDTALALNCCGLPLQWAGDGPLFREHLENLLEQLRSFGQPEILFACPSCQKALAGRLEPGSFGSVYGALKPVPGQDLPDLTGSVSVFDPCPASGQSHASEAVRQLTAALGLKITELNDGQTPAGCCGWGGHAYPASPKYVEAVAQDRSRLGDLPYVTYCSNCRDTFASAGKPAAHILTLMFDPKGAFGDPPPHLSRRRENRRWLKKLVLSDLGNIMTDQMLNDTNNILDKDNKFRLNIGPDLMAKMDRQLILEDDVRRTIEGSLASGRVTRNSLGELTGYLKLGAVTVWVTWTSAAVGYDVQKVYSHRMDIVDG